jgi:hypothetical protein
MGHTYAKLLPEGHIDNAKHYQYQPAFGGQKSDQLDRHK